MTQLDVTFACSLLLHCWWLNYNMRLNKCLMELTIFFRIYVYDFLKFVSMYCFSVLLSFFVQY